MDDLLSEKEQIENMRTWWSEYGNYVIAGVAIGAMSLFGINRYQARRRRRCHHRRNRRGSLYMAGKRGSSNVAATYIRSAMPAVT